MNMWSKCEVKSTAVLLTGTTDEQKVFQTIKNINPMLFKRLSGRLFFVLNKVDMHKFAAGWNVEECRKNIVQCVTKAVGLPDFRLRPEQASQSNELLLTTVVSTHSALCS